MIYRIYRENTMEQIATVKVKTPLIKDEPPIELVVDERSSFCRVKKVSSQPQLDGDTVVWDAWVRLEIP